MARAKRAPRWLKVLTASLVALMIVLHIGGGIVFADMIHADALTPQSPTPDNGVYVVGIGDDTITLTSKEEREDTIRPGVAGLEWAHGYGRIGPIVGTEGLEVTRSFTLVSGTQPPKCDGPLVDCIEVDIDSWTFQTDPSDVGLAFDEVEFDSPLGALGAWRVDGGDGDVWAIHAHGWRASRREALRSLAVYHGAGITSLVIDYRNDEGAPGDPSELYRFGRTEWEDVEAALDYAIANGAEDIVLVGYSTGAALHLAFLENSSYAGDVDAAVFDSPNADMGSAVAFEATKRTIPGTPIPVPGSLTWAAMTIADLRWDVGWDEIDYVDRAGDIVRTPTLVFHGVEDDRVPIEVARRLQAGAPELIELVEVPEAGHVTSWNVDPDGYEDTLAAFLLSLERN